MTGNDMVFVEMEYDEEGILKPEHLEGLTLEQIQDIIDVLNQAMKADTKNLEILRGARDKKAFAKMAELKVDTFDEGSHTYTKSPKTKISGDLLGTKHPVIWTELTSKYRSMFDLSTKDMEDYLKSKGAKPAQRKKILDEIKIHLKDGIKVTKH